MSYQPKFSVTPHLITIIEEISALRERIVAATIQVPWLPALQKDARVRNTHSSTAIEGNPLTLEEVKLFAEGKEPPLATKRSRGEILNYFAGLAFIEKFPPRKSMTKEALLRLHAIMAKNVMDQGTHGVYRTIQVRVGNYFPPPPEVVPTLMKELLDWWNHESTKWSPVITSAILHYRLEEIHPFADGNGRVGRALALWELTRRRFDTQHIFSVDEIYWENRPRYYQALQWVQNSQGDLSSWLEFVAEAIHLTLERVWLRVKTYSEKMPQHKVVLTPKQERLLYLLREKGAMAPNEIWKVLKLSKQGAMNLIHPLLKAGLVVKEGTRKSGKYRLV